MNGARLRVLMVTTFYPPANFGGDGIFIRRLANTLAGAGHEVAVAHDVDAWRLLTGLRDPGPPPRDPGVRVHPLRSRWGRLSPLAVQQLGAPLLADPRLGRLLEEQWDVINFHNVSLVGGPGILRRGRGIKLYTIHEYWLVCPAHVRFRFGREHCDRPGPCLPCTIRHRRPPQWWRLGGVLRDAMRHVDLFLAPTSHTLEAHREVFPGLPLARLPLFVPPASGPPPAAPPEADRGPYLLFAGRLERLKGLHSILPLAARHGWRLVVAGSGSQEADLRRQAAGHGNIRFAGRVGEERMRSLMRHAAALIVPSLCPECVPLVIPEAFREGTPVIARAVGGIPETVGDEGGGILWRTEGELEEAVRIALSGGSGRREMGERARAAWVGRYTPRRYLEGYLSLVERLVEGRRQASGDSARPSSTDRHPASLTPPPLPE